MVPSTFLDLRQSAAATVFNPLDQTFAILFADGTTEVPVSVAEVDTLYHVALITQINYGVQIGACIVMLLVVLTMTPRNRFARIPTRINIAALLVCLIHSVLLSLYFPSAWFEFYTVMSGDYEFVPAYDYTTTVVGTLFSIPQLMLIQAALALQAWSMISLWPSAPKWSVVAASTGIVLVSLGFRTAADALQIKGILYGYDLHPVVWVRQTDLACGTASICWFCFLFMSRLGVHMWTHRSILPSVRGLNAMEVLVMTNGILMLVPVFFAALEYATWAHFEPMSLTYTSVVIVLPLGTLVAQRLANPSAFNSSHIGYHAAGGNIPGFNSGHGGSTAVAGSGSGGGGGLHGGSAAKLPLFTKGGVAWPSRASGGGASSRLGSDADLDDDVRYEFTGRPAIVGGGVSVRVEAPGRKGGGSSGTGIAVQPLDPVALELARIDEGDLERGVRVHRDFEQHDESVGHGF